MTRYDEHSDRPRGGQPHGKTPHGRLKYTPRGQKSQDAGTSWRVRQARAAHDDVSAYSRDRYAHRPDRTEDAGEREDARDERQQRPERTRLERDRGRERPATVGTASEFSRDRVRARYAGHERHASHGGPSPLERLQELREERAGRGGRGIGGGALALSRGRIVGLVVAVILAVLLIGAIVWYVQVSSAMHASADVSGAVTAETPGKPYYVLVLGSDKRPKENDVARADTIMLCRVDEANKKVTMISLPRDLRVQIEGHGYGKLNSALSYNGFPGMIRAASNVSGVPISYYAVMYFNGFRKLVDDLGGVEVDVPAGTYYHGTWVNDGQEGKNVHINGKEALVLARCRHGNPPDQGAYAAGDYQRTKNQRNLMKAIVKKIMSQPVVAMPGQVLSVAQCVETNMPAYKLAFVALAMRGIDPDTGMYSATAPATGQYIDGVSYQILDDAKWQQMMARVEAGEDPNG